MNKVYEHWIPRETLGERIRRVRTEKRLSMDDLKNTNGVNKSVISRVENGHDILLGNLYLIAQALDSTVSELLAGVNLSEFDKE